MYIYIYVHTHIHIYIYVYVYVYVIYIYMLYIYIERETERERESERTFKDGFSSPGSHASGCCPSRRSAFLEACSGQCSHFFRLMISSINISVYSYIGILVYWFVDFFVY